MPFARWPTAPPARCPSPGRGRRTAWGGDRGNALQPRLRELEAAIATAGRPLGKVIDHEISALALVVARLRDDVEAKR